MMQSTYKYLIRVLSMDMIVEVSLEQICNALKFYRNCPSLALGGGHDSRELAGVDLEVPSSSWSSCSYFGFVLVFLWVLVEMWINGCEVCAFLGCSHYGC